MDAVVVVVVDVAAVVDAPKKNVAVVAAAAGAAVAPSLAGLAGGAAAPSEERMKLNVAGIEGAEVADDAVVAVGAADVVDGLGVVDCEVVEAAAAGEKLKFDGIGEEVGADDDAAVAAVVAGGSGAVAGAVVPAEIVDLLAAPADSM